MGCKTTQTTMNLGCRHNCFIRLWLEKEEGRRLIYARQISRLIPFCYMDEKHSRYSKGSKKCQLLNRYHHDQTEKTRRLYESLQKTTALVNYLLYLTEVGCYRCYQNSVRWQKYKQLTGQCVYYQLWLYLVSSSKMDHHYYSFKSHIDFISCCTCKFGQ